MRALHALGGQAGRRDLRGDDAGNGATVAHNLRLDHRPRDPQREAPALERGAGGSGFKDKVSSCVGTCGVLFRPFPSHKYLGLFDLLIFDQIWDLKLLKGGGVETIMCF